MPTENIKFRQEEILDHADVLQKIKSLSQVQTNLRKLFDHAAGLGYQPAIGPKDVFGVRQTIRAIQPVREKPKSAQTVMEMTFDLKLQNLHKPGSKDMMAIATATISAGQHSDTYDMLLEAPGGSFRKFREYVISGNKVTQTHSWWSRMKKCLLRKCAGACVGALITCSGTWAAYLACVAAVCGGCWTICAACASCRCRWWCKWASGCCK